jgi:hypothetical protein
MKVGALMEAIELRDDHSTNALLGEMEVSADCTSLRLRGASIEFPWDEQAERAVAGYLDIPKTYLHKLDPEFRAITVNHHLRTNERADTVVEWAAKENEPNQLIALQRPDRPVLPLRSVGEIVQRCFNAEDEVIWLKRDDKRFHLDIMTDHSVEVPPIESLPDRKIGDITRGGIRILLTPHSPTPPVMQRYFNRLVCTNGMCSPRDEGTISLVNTTLPGLIEEMERAAQRLLGDMQHALHQYAALAEQRVPGNPAAFAYRVAEETGLNAAVTQRIMARAGALPTDDPNVSLYDIANIFTEVAQSGISYATQVKMQEAAGNMAFAPEAALARCRSCEQKI